MAWIESHQDLAHHPKVARLAHALDVTVPTAIGHLHCLWWWCLSYAEDGDLERFSAFEIAHAAQWREEPDVFVDALRDAGWVDGTEVHDWQDYGGKLADRRRQDAERKRIARSQKSDARPQDVQPDGVRRQQQTTQHNTTTAESTGRPVDTGFVSFHAKRAADAVKERQKKGLAVRSASGLARTIQADDEFRAESERLWAHRDCEACSGKGFIEEYSPGAGMSKIECTLLAGGPV